MMNWIAYTSVSDADLGHDQIFEIVQISARNNPTRGVTGFLMYKENRFFQMIEGPQEGLDDLMDVIKRDPRHHSITVVASGDTAERRFPRWRMNRLANGAQMSELKQTLADAQANDLINVLDDFLVA